MIQPLFLLLALQAAPDVSTPGTAELAGARWRELKDAVDDEREVQVAQLAWASARTVALEYVEGGGPGAPAGLKIRARWTVRSLVEAPFLGSLIGPGAEIQSVRWDGRPATIATTRFGTVVLGRVARGSATLELEAFVPGDPTREALALELLPAVTGSLELSHTPAEGAPRLVPALLAGASKVAPVRVGSRFWAGDGRLELRLEPRAQTPEGDAVSQTLAVASVGVGLTVGDAALRVRARVRWDLRRGQLANSVSLRATEVGDDLELTGASVRSWRRAGDRVEVELQSPVSDRLELELTWTRAIPSGAESSLPLPQIVPDAAFRTTSATQLARDGEVEVLPALAGWDPITAAELPGWAQGLVEGAPTAAFRRAGVGEGRLELLRYEPVSAPPAVVDVASYTIATTREGRTLTRAHLELRNERAAFLKIAPPPGARIIGARVAGETALPARGEGGAWLLPLQRSVETVEGLISFPVEVALIGEGEPWSRRERRELALPTIDAEVAVTRVTVYLPPDYDSRLDVGDEDIVDAFTEGEGIHYGLGVGGVGAAEADARFQSAVRSWLNNDFEQAQRELDALEDMGAKNENIERLQSNLYVIQGQSDGKDKSLERRVKEQAKARAGAQQRALEEQRRRAESYRRAGEYEKAELEYKSALKLGEQLERLEQRESVEQQQANVALQDELITLEQERKRKRAIVRRESKKVGTKASKSKDKLGGAGSEVATTPSGSSTDSWAASRLAPPPEDVEGLLNPDSFRRPRETGGVQKAPRRDDDGRVIVNMPDGRQVAVEMPEQTATITPAGAPANAAGGEGGGEGGGGAAPAGPVGGETTGAALEDVSKIAALAPATVPPPAPSPAPPVLDDQPMIRDAEPEPEPEAKRDLRADALVTRDFTQVVDIAPTASRDSAGVSLAGRSRRGRLGGRRRAKPPQSQAARGPGLADRRPSKPPPPPDRDADGVLDEVDALPEDFNGFEDEDGIPEPMESADPAEPDAPAEPIVDRLPPPKTTASALSIIVPAAGEAVLYQRQLLKPGEAYTIQLDARERRRFFRRLRRTR